jgi:hypothetical protein
MSYLTSWRTNRKDPVQAGERLLTPRQGDGMDLNSGPATPKRKYALITLSFTSKTSYTDRPQQGLKPIRGLGK